MNRSLVVSLLLSVAVSAGSARANDSPLVEGMLSMMENFGFIDRNRVPLGVPYLPSAGAMAPYGMTGLPGLGGATGFGGIPGVSGMNPMTGMTTPGAWSNLPWGAGMPGGNYLPGQRNTATRPVPGLLDGVWELNNGGVVIIQADAARLYVTRDRYQDYLVRYDDKHFWWRPRDGSSFQRYRYEMREGRMILADSEGRMLLLRRRR